MGRGLYSCRCLPLHLFPLQDPRAHSKTHCPVSSLSVSVSTSLHRIDITPGLPLNSESIRVLAAVHASPLPTHRVYTMSSLREVLAEIDLEQYLSTFKSAGFVTWDQLSAITENELAALGIPRGHRRRLQREVARRSGWPENTPLPG